MKVDLQRPDDLGRCRVTLIDPPKQVFFDRANGRKTFTLFVALDGREHPIWTEDGPSAHPFETVWTGQYAYGKAVVDAVRGFADGTLPHDDAAKAIADTLTTWAAQQD
jgi:hypothetical protein